MRAEDYEAYMRWFDYGMGYENWFASGSEVQEWLCRVYGLAGNSGWGLMVVVIVWTAVRFMVSGGFTPLSRRVHNLRRVLAHRGAR